MFGGIVRGDYAVALVELKSEDIPHFDTLSSGGFLRWLQRELLGNGPEVSAGYQLRSNMVIVWNITEIWQKLRRCDDDGNHV